MTFWQRIKKIADSMSLYLGRILLVCLLGVLAVRLLFWNSYEIPENSALVVDFDDYYSKTAENDLLSGLVGDSQMDFFMLLQTINMAAADSRIQTLVGKISITQLDMVQIQELARAVMNFRAAGKQAVMFARGFGSFGQGNKEYYLASFFDKIYMQPHTGIGLTGVNIEVPFMKNTLDKIGVRSEFYSRYEYKNAFASLTDVSMSKAYKEEMQKLGSDIFGELMLDITANRKLAESFGQIVNKAPLSAEKGLELQLIDGIKYIGELEKDLKESGVKSYVQAADYSQFLQPNKGNLPTVALLELNGEITGGKSRADLTGESEINNEDTLEIIQEIAELPDLKAVVLRIDSPGGDYNAADEIYQALQALKKEKNVPVVVSQAEYAASGGYFISLAGDFIFAEPLTITGSIGVLGGKFVLEKMWQKLGINWNTVSFGNNSGMLSVNRAFSPAEKKIFNASLDEVYEDFTAKVRQNRKLTADIDKIARGRVWLGREAVRLGLADELGGYDQALNKALELGKVNSDSVFKLEIYPKTKSLSERLGTILEETGSVKMRKIAAQYGVDTANLKLFKRLQYDTVLLPFKINM